MIRSIVFDFDGVLVESVDIKTKAFGQLFEPEGPGIAGQVVDYHVRNTGVSRYDKIRYFYREFLKRPLSDAEFNRLGETFARLVVENVVKAPYVAGAEEFLQAHARAYHCYVASATPQAEIEDIIARRNMGDYFRKIYGAPASKSKAVQEILKQERLDPNHVVFIGDALSDYRAASETGVHFVARISGIDSLFQSVNCPKIKDLRNLKAVLRDIV